MRRFKILIGFGLLALAAMFTAVGDRNQTLAATYGCKTSQCPNIATCDGDHWTKTGECTISCYKDAGTTGEIVFSGGANCGASSGGGGGGGGGTIEILPGDSSYCRDNYWWDPSCSGPSDPYRPPPIN
jgi:hypothetical protein